MSNAKIIQAYLKKWDVIFNGSGTIAEMTFVVPNFELITGEIELVEKVKKARKGKSKLMLSAPTFVRSRMIRV